MLTSSINKDTRIPGGWSKWNELENVLFVEQKLIIVLLGIPFVLNVDGKPKGVIILWRG